MTKKIYGAITRHILENRAGYLAAAICMLIGLTLGALGGTKSAEASDQYISALSSAFSLHGASPTEILTESLWSSARFFLLIWISGWFIWLYPINLLEVLSKGFGIGYTTSYLITSDGLSGFCVSAISLLFQNILILPLLIIYSALQLRFSLNYSKIRYSGAAFKQRRRLIKFNLVSLSIVFLIIFLCSTLDAYVIPKLFSLICGNFA